MHIDVGIVPQLVIQTSGKSPAAAVVEILPDIEGLEISLRRVLVRITFTGAIYVSLVCVLPSVLITKFNVPFYFGGTALLIVVGVALDTVGQIESHMLMRHYEGFMKGGRIKGRR